MPKRFFLAALLTLAFALLSTAATASKLRIIYTYGPSGLLVERVLKHYEKVDDILFLHRAQDGLKAELMQLQERKSLPDAVIFPADHLGLHDILNYSEISPKLFKADIPDRIWSSGISDGVMYGAPFAQGNHLVMYYNKALVKKPAATWEELNAQTQAFANRGIGDVIWQTFEPYYFLAFLGAYGGWPMENGQPNLDTPSTVAALKFYKQVIMRPTLQEYCKYECALEKFVEGKVAYLINGEWAGKQLHKELGDFLGVAPIPKPDGQTVISPFTTHVIAFPGDSLKGEKRKALINFVNYMQSEEVQLKMWQELSTIPVENNAMDKIQKSSTSYLRDTLKLMDNTRPVPADFVMSAIWDAISKGFVRYKENALTAPQAADFMQKAAERYATKQQKINNPETDEKKN